MKKIIVSIFIIIALVGAGLVYYFVLMPNTNAPKKQYIYIPTGAKFKNVTDTLYKYKLIKNPKTFEIMAQQMRYTTRIKPGRYAVAHNMGNRALLRKLLAGNQDAAKLSFVKFRLMTELSKAVGKKLETDSVDIATLLYDNNYLKKIGFDSLTVVGMFVPNTYEVYWTTSADEFVRRMHREYTIFWNNDRLDRLKTLGLTQNQALTLASIIEEETNENDEKSRIAGVYLNRIKQNMPLQADPTVKFALQNFAIKRITTEMTLIQSPYNTYAVQGLPPAPICTPSVASIDAALAPEVHDYLYFCASEDFLGHHNFAVSYTEHLLNARRYQAALNEQRIY